MSITEGSPTKETDGADVVAEASPSAGKRPINRTTLVILIALAALLLLCCGGGIYVAVKRSGADQKIAMDWSGITASVKSFDQNGNPIDSVHGKSIGIDRDTRFDTTDEKGQSNADSKVLLISVGGSTMSHVGSSLLIIQDGLTDIKAELHITFDNNSNGRPWLNRLHEQGSALWGGKSKTILVRSQNGTPIAVFAGKNVITRATTMPTSTWFEVDGRYLFVYRCDYTVYDTVLLNNS